jgi:para-nitrobenzyl esterase
MAKRLRQVFLLHALIIPLCFFSACNRIRDQVSVDGGAITGTTGVDSSIRAYKGIPFAAPPVGELRWREPQPVKSWTGTYAADKFAPACIQNVPRSRLPWTEEFMHQGSISEDCLYLNVWTGAETTNEKRPIMVYLYGGGFSEGSNAVAVYNGEELAKKGVVLVGINYRVGPFGFLAHPELTAESAHHASGNYGLLDQVAALRWVKHNMRAFGGDPDNVTIFGQSAGAMSVAMLMQSPLTEGLFKRAIIQSGPGLFPAGTLSGNTPLTEAEQAGVRFAGARGAATLADLRAMPQHANPVLLQASKQTVCFLQQLNNFKLPCASLLAVHAPAASFGMMKLSPI